MATITINSAAYNDAKQFAETQNLSVDEFIVSLRPDGKTPLGDHAPVSAKFRFLPR